MRTLSLLLRSCRVRTPRGEEKEKLTLRKNPVVGPSPTGAGRSALPRTALPGTEAMEADCRQPLTAQLQAARRRALIPAIVKGSARGECARTKQKQSKTLLDRSVHGSPSVGPLAELTVLALVDGQAVDERRLRSLGER